MLAAFKDLWGRLCYVARFMHGSLLLVALPEVHRALRGAFCRTIEPRELRLEKMCHQFGHPVGAIPKMRTWDSLRSVAQMRSV